MKPTYRRVEIEDLFDVLSLVKELAIFEKEPDAVLANLDHYQSAFKDKWFEGMLAELDGKVVGMAVYYRTFSTWKGRMMYLEDFYVKPEFRSLGIGQQLFDIFLEEAKNAKCNLVKWQVLDWNKRAIAFYVKNKATIQSDWYNGVIYFNDSSE